MPDTRGRPLPSEILPLLKDPAIQNYLRSFVIATTSSESIGRYPGNGSAQDDQYVYPDDADATFAYNFDYVIPSNFQRLVAAKLSLKIRPFRSYNQFSATATGGQSNTHTHAVGGESGHTHSHAHNVPINNSAPAGAAVFYDGVSLNANHVGGGENTTTDATGSSGHNHGNTGGASADHTHTVSTSSVLGVFEDAAPVNPGITVKVDGVDVTAKIGGPFNTDQVEVDVTQVVATGVKLWHTLSLQPNQRVRITGILRLSYYVDSRLAQ